MKVRMYDFHILESLDLNNLRRGKPDLSRQDLENLSN